MPNTYNRKGVVPPHEQDDINISEEAQRVHEAFEAGEHAAAQILDEEAARNLICPTCDTMKEAEELRLRSLAEMDNYKKRLQREKEEQVKYAAENILADIIPALDNLDLALQYANNDACKDILTGVQMTRKLLLDTLKLHGLEQIAETNIPFNPEIHEAMGQEQTQELPENYVLRVLQKGYLLKDRLLRPAKVLISKLN